VFWGDSGGFVEEVIWPEWGYGDISEVAMADGCTPWLVYSHYSDDSLRLRRYADAP
jgi:hypothetical protein